MGHLVSNLSEGDIPPRGHVAMSGDRISNCHDGGWGRGCVCVTGILSVVRSEAAQHLYNAQNSILSHQMIWPNVNSAEVEKPWDNVF